MFCQQNVVPDYSTMPNLHILYYITRVPDFGYRIKRPVSGTCEHGAA